MQALRFGTVLLAMQLLVVTNGCSSDDNDDKKGGGSSGSNSGAGGKGNGTAGKGASGASGHFSSSGANNSGFPDDDGVYVGSVGDVQTKLPELPQLSNVVGRLNDDSVKITFDPYEGALDYRVYELPADGALDVKSDGHVVIDGGTYRCAGNRDAPPVMVDSGPDIKSNAIRTKVDNQMVGGYTRTLKDATLGYVYTGPGPGLVPVYALGEAHGKADVDCYYARFAASRFKKYTTSDTERDSLLKEAARDDGIVFYVPKEAGEKTKQIYEATDQPDTPYSARFYFPDGAEAAKHDKKQPAFFVDSEPGTNKQPLMRVFYQNICGMVHDELAVGSERFQRIYKQGDKLPWWSLLWTGVTKETTLVVEALDNQCPYPGHLSPKAFPQVVAPFGNMKLVHEPYVTLDDARAASPTKELFINGQGGPAWIWQGEKLTNNKQPTAAAPPTPKAVARAFLKVKPNPHPKMDFFADFAPGSSLEELAETPCENKDECPSSHRYTSKTYDVLWTEIEGDPAHDEALLATAGQVNGELWVSYADEAADTNGKFRLTPYQMASMEATKFLHVTMEATAASTARRYPQILVSDQKAPVQFRLPKGKTIVVQPRAEVAEYSFPIKYEIQLCKMRKWDVNDQCPDYDLHHIPGKGGTGDKRLAPNAELGELANSDQLVRFDAYLSTSRVYLFLDGRPYACALMPEGAAPSGPVTVTWGDVLYHSGVDTTFSNLASHLQIDTNRHFDNLGFSSGVDEPGWDETRLPCVPPITL